MQHQMQSGGVSMLPATHRDVDRFTPSHYDNAPGAPVYLIGVPSRIERARWKRAIAREGGELISRERQLAALRDAIRQTCDEPSQAQAFLILERFEDLTEQTQELLTPPSADAGEEAIAAYQDRVAAHAALLAEHSAVVADVDMLERKMRAAWPAFADLMAASEMWWELAPLMAAYEWLRGWEGGTDVLPPSQTNGTAGGPSRELIDRLPEKDVLGVGYRAMALLSLGAAEKKS